ncbi:MAG: AAA family ATPase [Pseudomonadales bacterium]|nr:AAA family ATPase [Pseudomonadales bacterium]
MPKRSARKRFKSTQLLGRSLVANTYLAQERKSGIEFLIKQIHADFVSPDVKDHIELQLQHLRTLNIPDLSIPELQTDGTNLQLIQPYPNGQLLSLWLPENKQISIRTILEIGIALVDAIASRHRATLTHKAIKPNNILILENPIRVQLVDEVQIIDSIQLSQFIDNAHYLRQTLPYLAPEMTGRIKSYEGYSTDLYAVGIVLYECIAGAPPFLSNDSLSIVHSHLAEEPRQLTELNTSCPLILSDIIDTLLRKKREKRYQSAVGLSADLRTCLDTIKADNTDHARVIIPSFTLKQHEASYHISIPSIIVGRDTEQKSLLDQYQRVSTGKFGLVMLSGLSGIGKTRLVQELELPIVAQRGYYTSGKFNQFASQLPYSTLVEALNRLIRQIMTENQTRVLAWHESILAVLGPNGQLLTHIAPELERIIGPQPTPQELPAIDAKSRFNDVFTRFLGCLATKAHPIVLFIDDMQWCDHATFDLLELILATPEKHPYLLLIGAYRYDEVDDTHRINKLEKVAERSSVEILNLRLEPIDITATNQMVAYILNTKPIRSELLTKTIFSVNAGNPLYICESLRWLHDKEGLKISEEGNWVWNEDAIQHLDIPANATDIFIEKLKNLPENIQNLLAAGALLGAQFKLVDLAEVAQLSVSDLHNLFIDVFDQRILLHDKEFTYFFHDQIQAAAAKYLTIDETKQYHRRIARNYIERVNEIQQHHPDAHRATSLFFTIAEHLARSRSKKAPVTERIEEAKFNYLAGAAALESLALEAGIHYLNEAAKLSTESMWDSHYEFMLSLHKKLAHASIINANQSEASVIVERSLKYVRDDVEKAEFLYEQSVAHAVFGDLNAAINIASQALILLGRPLPTDETEIKQEISAMESRIYHSDNRLLEQITALPRANNQLGVLLHKLYGELLGYLFFSGQIEMTRLTAFRAMNCSFEFGNDDFVCYALACISYILCIENEYVLAYEYEAAANTLMLQFPDSFGSVKSKGALSWAVMHMRHPVTELRDYAAAAASEGLRCGELRYGGLAKCVEQWFAFVQADDIPTLDAELKNTHTFSKQCNLALPLSLSEAMRLSLRPLLFGRDQTPNQKEGIPDPQIPALVEQWSAAGMSVSVACYHTFSGIVSYYHHRYTEAEFHLTQAESFLPGLSTGIVEKLWYIFRYLVGLQIGFKGDEEFYQKKVLEWASHGPMLIPYTMLMEAETAVKQGDFKEIRSLYLDAIDSAHNENYVLLEAFLNERLFEYLDECQHHSSDSYRKQANNLYQSCGVATRIMTLNADEARSPEQNIPSEQHSVLTSESSMDSKLDVQFLFDAIKTITSELDLNKLQSTILTAVMARLGAKTGYLLIPEHNVLVPRLKAIKYEDITVTDKDDFTFNLENLSSGIANYVFNSGELLILDNAFETGDFVTDAVVQACKLRSILCLPIVMHKTVLGVLYFENSFIDAVFTTAQVKQADLLTAQSAIALQNSNLLQETIAAQETIQAMNRDLESTIEARTQELQRKQLELTHAGRLASMGELATGIAHELGQPLQIIQVASRIIQEECASDAFDQAELIPFAKDIIEQVDRASGIVRNMRAYGRNDDNLIIESIDIVEPFNQSMVFFIEQFRQHQIELKLHIEEDLPHVLVSPQKFQQIVVNLLSNARHAVDSKLKTNLHDYQKKIDARLYLSDDNNAVILEVQDNGVGMNDRTRLKCMDPFFTTKKVGEGTGLGLSIVHGLIDEFNFSITVTSEAGIGSLFQVTMPVLGNASTSLEYEAIYE